jgi:hypothetical protein
MTQNSSDTETGAGTLRSELDATTADAPRADRPDLRAPRGNQDVDAADVERGEEKFDRVLGW